MADVTTLFIKVDSDGVVVASKNLNDLAKQSNTTTQATDRLTNSTKANNVALRETNVTLARASSGFKTVGRDLQRYGLLLAAAGTATAKFATDLSGGLGEVQTLIPETGDRIFELEESVKQLSVSSGKSFNDLTRGLYQTISAFQDTEDTVNIFTQATEAAIAGASTVADSIALASAVTKAYGDTTAEATDQVFDLAFETVRLGQTTFPELANGIQTATDSAVRLGVSQQELFATFSALTGVIGDASEVATKFRSASASLLNPNEALLVLFNQLSEQTGEVIQDGEDFVRVAGGWQEALALIVDTAKESNQPLQTYIRRIEGITLASRLAGNSAEKYASDLIAANNATGASELAYRTAKEGIDEYRQSLLEARQQIIVAAAEVGDNLLPKIADLVQTIADAFTAFSELDESIQEAVISAGAFVVALGPVLIAVGSFLRAWRLVQGLNVAATITSITAVLGPAGLIGVLGAVTAAVLIFRNNIFETTNRLREQKDALTELQSDLLDSETTFRNIASRLGEYTDEQGKNEEVTRRLIVLYPELADELQGIVLSTDEAYAALINYNRELAAQEAPELFAVQQEQLSALGEQYRRADDQLFSVVQRVVELERNLQRARDAGLSDASLVPEISELEATNRQLLELRDNILPGIRVEAEEIRSAIAEDLLGLGVDPQLVGDFELVFNAIKFEAEDSIREINNTIDSLDAPGDASLKTWQEWFEEITGVAKQTFGNSGVAAANAFEQSLQENLSQEITFSEIFDNDDVDFVSIFEDQLVRVKEVFRELSEIAEDEIALGEFFKVAGINAQEFDNVMAGLADTAVRLQGELEAAKFDAIFSDLDEDTAAINSFAQAFPKVFTESERLGAQLSAQKGALDNLVKEGYDPANTAVQELAASIVETQQAIAQNKAIDNLNKSLINLATNAVADSFYEIGRAIGNSAADMEDFASATSSVLESVLKALPALFIQAGLQLIIAGNVPLGLGLLATGLAGNILAGSVQGIIDEKEEEARERAEQTNASGAVYSYARGGTLGSFENSIVNTPTTFNNGSALMGEAGAEAILPLTRTSSGDLGVAAVGGGDANVKVTIINNTGAEVSQRETTGSDGSKELEITIGKFVNNAINNGTTDKSMRGRYGIIPTGRN